MYLFILLFVHILSTEALQQCYQENLYLPIGQSRYISTPNFPFSYPDFQHSCYWTAYTDPGAVIHMMCDKFNIDDYGSAYIRCERSRLYVSLTGDPSLSDGKYYCGRGTLQVTTFYNYFSAYFETLDNYYKYQGFSCRLTAVQSVAPPNPPATPKPTSNPPAHTQCGIKGNARIVNGAEAEINEWPWQVALATEVTDGNNVKTIEQFCGGAIIAPDWIVTASHCAEVYPADQLVVITGDHHLETNSESSYTENYRVEQVILHEEYNAFTVDNDIALIKLSRSIVYNDGVGPICIPKQDLKDAYADQSAWVTGWGVTSFQGSTSDILQEVELPVKTKEQCKSPDVSEPYISDKITDNMICTYKKGYDACQGDSGGPLSWEKDGQYYLIGVVSWGIRCAVEKHPGVYAKVDNYINWIQSHTGVLN